MKSENYVELQFEVQENQAWVDSLTELIDRLENSSEDFQANSLRQLRERYVKKVKTAQDRLDYEQLTMDL